MSDLGKLAERLAARRVTIAQPRPPRRTVIALCYGVLRRYPTATLICAYAAVGAAVLLLFSATILILLAKR